MCEKWISEYYILFTAKYRYSKVFHNIQKPPADEAGGLKNQIEML